jgi:hypothetical protein
MSIGVEPLGSATSLVSLKKKNSNNQMSPSHQSIDFLFSVFYFITLAMGWTTEGLEFESQWGQEFSLLHVFQTSSGPTQLPIQWVPGLFPQGYSGRGMKLTTCLQLVPRSRKCGSINSLPHTPSWSSA